VNQRIPLFFLFWALFVAFSPAVNADTGSGNKPVLVLAVQGSHSVPVLAQTIQPLVNYLEAELDVSIRWETASRHQKLIDRIRGKRYDLLFVDTPTTLVAYDQAGYRPIARIPGVISTSFVGFVDGPALILEDMKGLRIGYLRPMMLATQLAKRHLRDKGLNRKKFFKEELYLANHNSALNALRHGRVDVISIATSVYGAHDGEFDGRDLIIIDQTRAVPQYAFSVGKRVKPALRSRLQQALLRAHKSAMARTFFTKRIVRRIIATDINTYAPYRYLQQYLTD
jgi:ABC-type phosphate/phosphonate transport system substrate-binding protein